MQIQPTRRALLSAAAGCLVLCTGVRADPPITRELRLARNPDLTSEVDGLVLRDLYQRIGVKLSVIEMPANRATVEAKEGRVDGEVNRIRAYGEIAPMLIRIDPPIHLLSISALYRKGSTTKVQTLADLAPYTVGYVRGIKFAEEMAKSGAHGVATDSPDQLVKMLQTGRVDVIVNGTVTTRFELNMLGISDGIDSTVLLKMPLHHYLHEKNRDMVPTIAALIAKATESGELDKLTAHYQKQLFDAAVPPKK